MDRKEGRCRGGGVEEWTKDKGVFGVEGLYRPQRERGDLPYIPEHKRQRGRGSVLDRLRSGKQLQAIRTSTCSLTH